MKRIFVDTGNFYTKVCVFELTESGSYEFFGRTFFPTMIAKIPDLTGQSRSYEHEGVLYKVGYDCGELDLTLASASRRPDHYDLLLAMVIIKKIVFDYADADGNMELYFVLDTPDKIAIYQEAARQIIKEPLEVKAFRGLDRRPLRTRQLVGPSLVSVGEAVHELLFTISEAFTCGLVLDIGYDTSKLYLITEEGGVELFRILEFGCAVYYRSVIQQLLAQGLSDVNYFWLIKQIELGCQQIELVQEQPGVDISLIIANIKWDLNKDFVGKVSEILTHYYENRVQWAQVLVITGGGSFLSGELLRHSLMAGGFEFRECYVEKSPLYAMLDAVASVYNPSSLPERIHALA